MRPFHVRAALVSTAVLCLTACQPAGPPPEAGKPAPAPQASGVFRERGGWEVVVFDTNAPERTRCVGRRVDRAGPSLSFFAGSAESGFSIEGTAIKPADGSVDRLTARLDGGEPRGYDARAIPGGGIEARFPTQRFDEMMLPLARARAVSLSGAKWGAIGDFPLTGSSWAIYAADECRRMRGSD